MTTNGVRALILAGLATIGVSGHTSAAGLPMRYLPLLETSGGVLNPGVIFAFNPQPDPPGIPILDLANRYEPVLIQPGAGGGTYDFVMSFVGLPGLLLPAVQKPDMDGVTDFTFDYAGHAFEVGLAFSNPSAIRDWGSFNPQPDPPGVWFGDAITYAAEDPRAAITVFEDGSQLKFTVPEPATWTLMGLGFASLGLLARGRGGRSRACSSRA
jgi:PEP-CTERM motif